MSARLTGRDLTLEDLVAVARRGERVCLDPHTRERMEAARAIADRAFSRGDRVYGLTTGYGVKKCSEVGLQDVRDFNRRQLHDHRVAHGPSVPEDVVRATMLKTANAFAGATSGVRPLLAERLLSALNEGPTPVMRRDGSVGASDLGPLADLATEIFADVTLEPGEGLACINQSSYGTAWAALALYDTTRLLDAADVAGAMALEGFAANPSVLHPGLEREKSHPALTRTLSRIRRLLDGSFLWSDVPRNLQDPLTFRSTAALQAAARDATDHALEITVRELNAPQGNPVVLLDEDCVISAAVYEVAGLSAALDYVRAALVPTFSAAAERVVKLLDTAWSGLPTGLATDPDAPDLAMSIHAIAVQSSAAEAMTLAQPVSFLIASTCGAEGIEDRASHLPLSARRLAEMVEVGRHIVAVELLVAAQAVDLRGRRPLGDGTAAAHRLVRHRIPFTAAGDPTPVDVGPLQDLIEAGDLARPVR